MHITVEQGDLLRGLEHTLGVVDRKGHMPILAHCLMQANGQGLVISATDLEIYFRGSFPAEVREPGTFAVRAHTLHSLLKGLPKATLEIIGDENQIKLAAGESLYKFMTLPQEHFPPLPAASEKDLAEVEAGVLVELINKVSFSLGDDLQYPLQAVWWERVEKEGGYSLRLVTTDGHRLSLADGRLPGPERLEAINGILVPAKAVREIKRFAECDAKDGKIRLGLMWPKKDHDLFDEEAQEKEGSEKAAKKPPRFLCLKSGGQELSVRLLDRKFPEYRRIIPESFEQSLVFSRQELAAAIRRISLLTPERFRGVVFTLGEGTVELTHENTEVGTGREVVELIKVEDISRHSQEPVKISFNARYLLEPLAVMKGDLVVLEINEPGRPVRLTDPADPLASWLVMPMDL